MRAELHQVVTFATHPFHGNPAFVLTLPGAPETRTMQEVCDLLETKVVATLSSMSGEGFDLRFFTPLGEHPGAGHAAMAAAHVAFVARNGDGLGGVELLDVFAERRRKPAGRAFERFDHCGVAHHAL